MMPKFCNYHTLDLFSPSLDLTYWLEGMFEKYEFYKYSPEIVMGSKTFEIFKSITELNQVSGHWIFSCKGFAIPLIWIIIDYNRNPYYISIKWEEEPGRKISRFLYGNSIQKVFYDDIIGLDRGQRVPHIDHVKFNGPATIVFCKDGTKTVVKHDGKGRKDKRQAVLYAFIRKIYGEGRPYNNILNEIEEAVK